MNSPLSTEMYTLLAMAARYFFAGLMMLIVFRAWRITVRDNRRAKLLRDLSPETGCVGELIVNPGTRTRQTIPIPREGVLGSGPKADIHIHSNDVLPAHAHVEERQGGLLIRPIGRAQIALGKGGVTGDQLFAQDGDILVIGEHQFLIVLFQPDTDSQSVHIEIPIAQEASTPTRTGGKSQQFPPPTPPIDSSNLAPAKPTPKTTPKTASQATTRPTPAPSNPSASIAAKATPKTTPKTAAKSTTKPTTKPKTKRKVDPFTFFDETDDDFFDEDKLWNEHRK